MGRKLVALVSLALVAGVLAGPVSAAGSGVKMGESNEKYFFSPATTYVSVGGTVTWTNGTDVAHTVTSDNGNELSSGNVAANATFSHTFASVGTFSYKCTIHPYMTAQVIVLAAGVTPPPTDALGGLPPSSGTPVGGVVVMLILGLAGAALALRRLGVRA
jgi:plastocyanin